MVEGLRFGAARYFTAVDSTRISALYQCKLDENVRSSIQMLKQKFVLNMTQSALVNLSRQSSANPLHENDVYRLLMCTAPAALN